MRLKEGFIVHSSGSESFLVPVGGTAFSGIVKGNAILGEILSQLETETTADEIVKNLMKNYDADEKIIARDVDNVLAELRRINALEE